MKVVKTDKELLEGFGQLTATLRATLRLQTATIAAASLTIATQREEITSLRAAFMEANKQRSEAIREMIAGSPERRPAE